TKLLEAGVESLPELFTRCYHFFVPLTRKLLVASLLVLCVAIQVLEASGRWDRTLADANDEADIVAVVLCIGVALTSAGSIMRAIRSVRLVQSIAPVLRCAIVTMLSADGPDCPPTLSPPLPLRI